MDASYRLSRLFFLWIEPTIWKGFRRPLKAEDRVPLPECLEPGLIHKRFTEAWSAEVRQVLAANAVRKGQRQPSVWRVLGRLFGFNLLLAIFIQLCAVTAKFGCIVILRQLVVLIVMGSNGDADRKEGIVLAIALASLNALDGILCTHATWKFSMTLYSLISFNAQAVLKKGIDLHPGVQDKFRRGDLVNLALSDCNRLVDMAGILMLGASAPIMFLFAMVTLGVLLGPSVLASLLGVVSISLLINRNGKLQGSSFRRKAMWQGRRLATMNEMLQSVRFTKLYALEEHYEKQAQQHRENELAALRTMKASISVSWPVAATVPITTSAIVLSLQMIINGGLPSPQDTLAVIAAARFMYTPFAFFSSSWGAVNMLLAVVARISTLLLQPEVHHRPFTALHDTDMGKAPPTACAADVTPDIALSIKGQDFRWGLDAYQLPTLKSITLEVPRGELWAVVGPLGSGKSSLLAAAAGAISCDTAHADDPNGGVFASGPSRVYVAQEPMVVNDTLRQNVIFGIEEVIDEKMEARYAMALEAAALTHDLEILPAGDATEIGEKGLTLSGGQKARVALARAAFASKRGGLVLLDDPLAAVDAHVGAHLFEQCIVNALDGTTRLLVTNQLQFLNHPAVAHVLVMEDGSIVEQGRFADLLRDTNSRLAKMAASVGGGTGCETDGTPAKKGTAASDSGGGAELRAQQSPKTGTEIQKDGRLTKAESRAEGAVTWAAFEFYIKALGGYHIFAMIALFSWCFNLSEIGPDVFLAIWQEDLLERSQGWYLGTWLLVGYGGCLLNFSSRLAWVFASTHAARNIHTQLLKKVLNCTTSFFDRTPSGQIMNKLGEDQMLADFTAPLQLEVLTLTMWSNFDIIVFCVIVRPLVGPVVAVFALVFLGVRELHRRANREAVRLWLITKSPLFGCFEETLSGITTIRAFGRAGYFQQRFEQQLHKNVSWLMMKDAINLWMEQRLSVLASSIVLALALQMVLLPGVVSSSVTAVAVIASLQLGFQLKSFASFLVQTEGTFASMERILQFIQTSEQEPARCLPSDEALERSGWPCADSSLVFEDVCLRYLPHLPLALDHFSAALKAGEKVGIVGRTGSGKSTIMGAMFRLFGLESGRILLGGVDVGTCGLAVLRRKVTIVPQDPVLFTGDLRRNLDPLGLRTDDEVWEGLRRCSLAELVDSMGEGLGLAVSEGGRNFSVGERQVLCLARALLRGTRVCCLDEATANVDPENDERIQKVLTKEVKDCLVLTIAHRLHTVLRSDRIMVLEKGRLAQLDTPRVLLSSPGIFRDLATQAGLGLGDLSSVSGSTTSSAEGRHALASFTMALSRAGKLCST